MSRRSGLALLLVAAAAPAGADTIDATSTTLLAGHADERDGRTYTVVPAYEMVSLLASDLQVPYVDDLRIQLSGWGMAAFGTPGDNQDNCKFANASLGDNACVSGDLDLGYIEGKLAHRRITVRIGRQFITGGAARMTQMDGLDAEVKLYRGLGLQAYGGVPVTPRFSTSRGDALAGGRLFYRQSVTTEAGASAIYVLGQGVAAREDAALDARWSPIRQLTFTGYWLYSLYEMRTAEGTAAITAQPWRIFDITAEFRRVAPDLFLPRNSILSVFAQETRDEAGVWFSVTPRPRVRLYGDYHLVLDDSGTGHQGGVKASIGTGNQGTVGAETRVVHLPDKGYLEGRVYGIQRLGDKISVTLDVDGLLLERALNGQDWSLTATATVGWDFSPGWHAVLTAMGDVDPFVNGRLEAMAKLVYNYSTRFHEVKSAATPDGKPGSEVKQ